MAFNEGLLYNFYNVDKTFFQIVFGRNEISFTWYIVIEYEGQNNLETIILKENVFEIEYV